MCARALANVRKEDPRQTKTARILFGMVEERRRAGEGGSHAKPRHHHLLRRAQSPSTPIVAKIILRGRCVRARAYEQRTEHEAPPQKPVVVLVVTYQGCDPRPYFLGCEFHTFWCPMAMRCLTSGTKQIRVRTQGRRAVDMRAVGKALFGSHPSCPRGGGGGRESPKGGQFWGASRNPSVIARTRCDVF